MWIKCIRNCLKDVCHLIVNIAIHRRGKECKDPKCKLTMDIQEEACDVQEECTSHLIAINNCDAKGKLKEGEIHGVRHLWLSFFEVTVAGGSPPSFFIKDKQLIFYKKYISSRPLRAGKKQVNKDHQSQDMEE